MSYRTRHTFVGVLLSSGVLLGSATSLVWTSNPHLSIGPLPVLYLFGALAVSTGIGLGVRNARLGDDVVFYVTTSAGFLLHFLFVSEFEKLPVFDKLRITAIVVSLLVVGVGMTTYSVGQAVSPAVYDETPRLESRQILGTSWAGVVVLALSVIAIMNTTFAIPL